MLKHSFTFGGVDMQEKYGVWVVSYDTFAPPLRQRMVTVPFRSGSYDYGAKYYDNRTLRLTCDTRIKKTRNDIRELAYVLSFKNEIALWDEPEKRYVGRMYDPSELEDIYQTIYKFSITFICDPFAYGDVVSDDLQSGKNAPDYAGTADAPTRITITNAGSTSISGIQIVTNVKRHAY